MEEVDKKMDKRMSRARCMELQRQRKKEKEARRKKALDEGDSLASNSTLTHHGKHHGGSLASDESSISTWMRKDRDTTKYQPFFDAAYPDMYTETMRRKEARAAARRVKDDESTVVTHQSLPPAPAPAG